jgi:hypothetical protein
MFLSKIWIFLVAIVAAIALTLALAMPRPAERTALAGAQDRISRACGVAGILLRDSARNRIQVAGEFSRGAGLDDVLFNASKGEAVTGEQHSSAKTLLSSLNVSGAEAYTRRLDVSLLDRRGRVVARSGEKAKDFGDTMAGYFVVDDALDGYLRDDVWVDAGKLFMVAASPVVTRQLDWAGAVVVRELVNKDLAEELAAQLNTQVSFYAAGEPVATSDAAAIHPEVLQRFAEMPPRTTKPDCELEPFVVTEGDTSFWVQISRLPGEAGDLGAFYAVYDKRTEASGFMGALDAIRKDDLSFGNFPWLLVGGVFLLLVIGGIGLTVLETDRPIRRLGNDAVKLAKGEAERLDEMQHRGRLGSIARSVNIAIDKILREAKSAKKDLDNLLGPLPGDSGAVSALPSAGPLGTAPAPFAPPPPSEFKFGGNKPAAGFDIGVPPAPSPIAIHTPPPAARANAAPVNEAVPPPPIALPGLKKPPLPPSGAKTPRPITPPPRPARVSAAGAPPGESIPPPSAIDDDILGGGKKAQTFMVDDSEPEDEETRVAGYGGEDDADAAYFREIFGEFVNVKKQCGESVESLTFAKFSRKLAANRDALIAKHGCKTVKFQVYVRDGKAALKASPIRG